MKFGWQSLGAGVGYTVLSDPDPAFVVVGGVVDLVGIEPNESFAVDFVGEVGSVFVLDSVGTVGSEVQLLKVSLQSW